MKYQHAHKSRSRSQLPPVPGGSSNRAVLMDVDKNQGGKNVIYSAGISENNRLENGASFDARMHPSLAVEKSQNSLSTGYKDLPSASFSSHGFLKKDAVEPPSEVTNSYGGRVTRIVHQPGGFLC